MIKRFFRRITGLQQKDDFIVYLILRNNILQKEIKRLKNEIVKISAEKGE